MLLSLTNIVCVRSYEYGEPIIVTKGYIGDESGDIRELWGNPLTIVKYYDGSTLTFEITMPKIPDDNDDGLQLWLDYDANGFADAVIFWNYVEEWFYYDGVDVLPIPSVISATNSSEIFSITLPVDGRLPPLGSNTVYRFALVVFNRYVDSEGEGVVVAIPFPDIEPESSNTGDWEEEYLVFSPFVVPEVPYGVFGSLIIMIIVFLLYSHR